MYSIWSYEDEHPTGTRDASSPRNPTVEDLKVPGFSNKHSSKMKANLKTLKIWRFELCTLSNLHVFQFLVSFQIKEFKFSIRPNGLVLYGVRYGS